MCHVCNARINKKSTAISCILSTCSIFKLPLLKNNNDFSLIYLRLYANITIIFTVRSLHMLHIFSIRPCLRPPILKNTNFLPEYRSKTASKLFCFLQRTVCERSSSVGFHVDVIYLQVKLVVCRVLSLGSWLVGERYRPRSFAPTSCKDKNCEEIFEAKSEISATVVLR